MRQRALIVDDNLPLAENLAEILSEEGYDVRVYGCPAQALLDGCGRGFDVAVLDMCLPGMDGVALHRALAAREPSARFVMISAFTEDERVQAALAAGVQIVLPKPVPLVSLLEALAADKGQSSQ